MLKEWLETELCCYGMQFQTGETIWAGLGFVVLLLELLFLNSE